MVSRLIIDDVREFVDLAPGDETTYARTVKEARNLLDSQEYDEIWWDYDMGFMSDTYGLAKDVASGKQQVAGAPLMVIHTGSPVGRENLWHTLSRSEYAVEEVYVVEETW